ncbi:unnamed protein product [Blepharisma stoltei]|uniref:G domain-containing protein n=1 Tax=Blepharisma stoltei TaxID=1481888 RepID=A0AAU9IQX9_9CILI|nr:unnamed protein product [Blepharisma stoltei]
MEYPYIPNSNPFTSYIYKSNDLRLGANRVQPLEEPKTFGKNANSPKQNFPNVKPNPHAHPYNPRLLNMNPYSPQYKNKDPEPRFSDLNNIDGDQKTEKNEGNLLRYPSLTSLSEGEQEYPGESSNYKTPPHEDSGRTHRKFHEDLNEIHREKYPRDRSEKRVPHRHREHEYVTKRTFIHMMDELRKEIKLSRLNSREVVSRARKELDSRQSDEEPEDSQHFTKVRKNEQEETKIKPKNPKKVPRQKKLNIPPHQKIVSLIIGQTGSGKSTFINIITNFFRNGTLENKKIAIPTKDFPQTELDFGHAENGKGVDQSQTVKCCRYDFKDLDSGSTFTFIDTPGLSDTRGVDQDDKNIKIIENEILKFTDINAIIIVQNGSEARKTASVNNSLVRIRNALPRKVENSIVLVLTNSHISTNFNVNSLPVTPKYTFLMENNAFNIANPNEWVLMEMQPYWDKSMRKVKEIAECLCKMGSFSVRCFKEMIEEKDRAKQSFHQAKIKLQNLYSLQEQLEEIKIMKESSLNNA